MACVYSAIIGLAFLNRRRRSFHEIGCRLVAETHVDDIREMLHVQSNQWGREKDLITSYQFAIDPIDRVIRYSSSFHTDPCMLAEGRELIHATSDEYVCRTGSSRQGTTHPLCGLDFLLRVHLVLSSTQLELWRQPRNLPRVLSPRLRKK